MNLGGVCRYLLRGMVFVILWLSLGLGETSAGTTSAAIISGTITHQGVPVEGVSVAIGWDDSGTGMVTGSDGVYSFSNVPTGINIWIQVRAPLDMRLGFRSWGGYVAGSFSKDFELLDGYLLHGEVTLPDGFLYTKSLWFSISELMRGLPQGEWSGVGVVAGSFDVVLPPGIYVLTAQPRPIPYFLPFTRVDLRGGDVLDLSVSLVEEMPQAWPTDPPVAGLISVGEPDPQGVATITGQAGAVDPLSAVAVINLDAETIITTTSQSDGSFSAELFAPPGSSLTIKYDPGGEMVKAVWGLAALWDTAGDFSMMNPLPGAVITTGDPPVGDGQSQEFTAAGRFEGIGWAGWWMHGVLRVPNAGDGPGLSIQPGDTISMSVQVHGTSPALQCSDPTTVTLNLDFNLEYLFDAQGQAEPWAMWFDSFISTPTGIPIELEGGSERRNLGGFQLTGLTCVNSHTVMGEFEYSALVPVDLPAGVYSPEIYLMSNIPLQSGYPFVKIWYDDPLIAEMPLLQVGEVEATRIPWILLGNYPVNGLLGSVALEDRENYNLVNRVIYPPEVKIIPRLDERTGEPIVYRLEPGSNWLSSTDRRFAPPPHIKLALPSGELAVEVLKPDSSVDVLGPAPILQSYIQTPTLPDGSQIAPGTGHIGDMFHLTTLEDEFGYAFEQYGQYTIFLHGSINDIYGNSYPIENTYKVVVARVLDLDPAQLPTTPYMQGDAFAPGVHVFPPIPADIYLQVIHMPYSDPQQAITYTVSGVANQFGYFQPQAGTEFRFPAPGEFRVKIRAHYEDPDGTLWVGILTWGNVVEGEYAPIEAHGRRGMDYHSNEIDTLMPIWFVNGELLPNQIGIENYYPYFNGDIHWGTEVVSPIKGDSIHSIITLRDRAGNDGPYYDILRNHFERATNCYRWPPDVCSLDGLDQRIAINEAPLFITTNSGTNPEVHPEDIDLWAYWYASSERPDVHVREIVSEDNMGTAYWRFNDTYGYQIGEPATGDQAGDIKWEFGGIVFRVPEQGINQYAIYSSLWVLLPNDDPVGARVTAPFQDAVGAGVNGGPIMNLLGEEIDVLFLPKGIRPGDILEVGDTVSFSGHVGPPLDSRVEVEIISPSGIVRNMVRHANRIGWVYDPAFDFVANEAGRWTVNVFVEHDRPYPPTGVTPDSHNTGTVLGTSGQYEFYVVAPDSLQVRILTPQPGHITWDNGGIEPIRITGKADGAETVFYTIHDKGIVMAQGMLIPNPSGYFTLSYDAEALQEDFPMLSLTAHEGRWEGLADEVSINLLASGGEAPQAASITLIGEEIFLRADTSIVYSTYLPITSK